MAENRTSAHHAPLSAGARHVGRLKLGLALIVSMLVVQAVVAFASDSLALLSDAGHMMTDAIGLGMALAAITVAARAGAGRQRTFGLYRLEIFAALVNALLLIGVAMYVAVEAVDRFSDPAEVDAVPVLVVGVVGLAVNVVVMLLLRDGAGESLNVKGAYLEVFADMLGSLGVVIGAAVLLTTGWPYIDPIVGLAIALFIVPRAVRLGWQAVRVLTQIAPDHVDVDALGMALRALPNVTAVHDLHVWTLTSQMDVVTAHLVVVDGTDHHGVLDAARALLHDQFEIDHATLQVEPDTHEGCEELVW